MRLPETRARPLRGIPVNPRSARGCASTRGSPVAPRTISRGVDRAAAELRCEHAYVPRRGPSHVGDLRDRTSGGSGIAMAVEAPAHAEGHCLRDPFHLVYAAVAAHTADAGRNVRAVREVGVVGQLVNANPMHGPATLGAVADRREQCTVLFHGQMTVHARLRRRNVGDVGSLDRCVTVAAIETELADVESVAIRDGLNGTVSDVGVPRRKVVPDASSRERRTEDHRNGGDERELIPRAGEYLTQWLGPPDAGGPISRPRVRYTPRMTHVAPPIEFLAGDDRDPV